MSRKINFAIRNYEKYNQNSKGRAELNDEFFDFDGMKVWLLVKIDKKDCESFTNKILKNFNNETNTLLKQ